MPGQTLLEWLRGKRTRDIELPMPEGGRRDPRLPKQFDAAKTGRTMREGWESLSGLIEASKRKR